ncbi:MAG: hypothetical protein GX450_01045 [Verrucomicrobia bacterium]|nr:hypothetical protein [Verrucomicrobiota bacterium]
MNAGLGFDEAGQRVPVALPPDSLGDACPTCSRPYDEPDTPGSEASETRREALLRVLCWLASETDLRRIGWKCALAHWLIAQQETQSELAARLGVSKAAITQSLNAFRSEIAQCLQADDAP